MVRARNKHLEYWQPQLKKTTSRTTMIPIKDITLDINPLINVDNVKVSEPCD